MSRLAEMSSILNVEVLTVLEELYVYVERFVRNCTIDLKI